MVRKFRLYVVAVVAIAGLALGSLAAAGKLQGPGDPPESKHFKATLNGFQEVPSVSTGGFGEFEAELVEPEKLHYVFTYGGLEGGASLFAHVHFAQRSVNGGVSFFLCGGSTKPTPCPYPGGIVEGDVTPADIVGPNGQGIEPLSFAEILRAMRAGHAYVNIHTTPRWPGGEIRGQINNNDQREFVK